MKKTLATLTLVGLLLSSGGCLGRIVGEAWEGTTGGSGRSQIVDPVSGSLDGYTNFEMERFTDKTHGNVPAAFWTMLPEAFDKLAYADGLPQQAGGKTVIIRGSVIYYETGVLTDQVFGPLEEAVAYVELIDKETGRSLGKITAVGRTTKTIPMGPETKAGGLSKTIIKWINASYPEAMRDAELESRKAAGE